MKHAAASCGSRGGAPARGDKSVQAFMGHSNVVDFNSLNARDYIAWEATATR